MAQKYREIGLILNVEKSSSTLNKGIIEFMGQQFSADRAITMANKLEQKIIRAIDIIENAPANMHQKFILLSIVAISMVNYGPLVEQTSG